MNASVGADERLVVMLEARISEFEKRMRQAEQRGTRTYQGLRKGSQSATRQMERDMARAAGSMRQSLASITGSVGGMGKALAGGFLGGVAIGGLTEIVSSSRQVVRSLAEIGNEAKRAGLSAQAFQEWKYVAESNRISIDAVVDGFKELSLRADEFITTGVGPAAEAFGRLGFRAEDLKQKLKDPSALMLEIMQRLEGMDKAAQIRIADEIFGGTGGERFVELLGQGEGALRDTVARAHEVGAVMDEELIAKAAELDQRFRDLQISAGNFFQRIVVGAADAINEIADMRPKLDEVFSSEAEGRALLGDDTYDAMAANRDLVAQNSQAMEELEGHYQRLAETAQATAAELRGAIGTLDAWGYDEAADALRTASAEMDELTRAFRDGELSGEDFALKLTEVEANAASAFAELEAGDRVQFTGVMSQLQRLGSVIVGVISLAGRLKAALASAAGTAPEQVSTQALRDRHAAEAASMDSLGAMTEANDKFTASENARNSATKEQIALEREAAEVRSRAKASGAVLTEAEVLNFASASLAGDAARSAAGRGGGGGGGGGGGSSRRSGGGGGGGRQSGFARDLEQIKEETEALKIEAAVLTAAALSGETYADAMAYASEKAKLLAEAQKEGKQITPELEAQIDGLARAYAEAGHSAEEAAERLKSVQEAGERGAEAVAGIFTAALRGADAAKQAVSALLERIAEAMMQKAFAGLAASGAGGGFFAGLGNLLGFDTGGYTGNKGVNAIAGFVHGGEYVFSKKAVDRIGVGPLERLHQGAQGFMRGGLVPGCEGGAEVIIERKT